MSNKAQRIRRARKTRERIKQSGKLRLCVIKSNAHFSAQIIHFNPLTHESRVLVAASTQEGKVRETVSYGGNKVAASSLGKLIGERAKEKGIDVVAFDRSGYPYHGRVKAFAEAAREAGLLF